jgi:hypothetical protein
MAMRYTPTVLALATALLADGTALAQDVAATARDELREGYALKQAGNCRDALPHFAHSLQLAETLKALLNLADCEQQLGDLVGAHRHAARGRELAVQRKEDELASVAMAQLEAIDKRTPTLTIALAATSPPGCTIVRDGSAVAVASLGVALPANPGEHTITVRAPGHAERRFAVVLSEGAHQSVEVSPGPPEVAAATLATSAVTPPPTLALVLGGAGVVGLVVGSVLGLVSKSTYDHALQTECGGNPNGCSPQGIKEGQSAHGQATASTVAFVAGAVLLGAGGVLYFTAPKASVGVGTTVGAERAGIVVTGRW